MGKYFDVSYMIHSFPTLVGYVHVTLFITLVAALFGVILGCLIAVVRLNRVKIISQLLTVYISFTRGTPFLVQLFLIYFGAPEILSHMGISAKNLPPMLFVLIVFTLYLAAYSSEIMRSSIQAVGKGEMEAALTLGMTPRQAYIRIILPEAFGLAVPPLINTVLSVLKGTSLIFNVGIVDIMRKADLMGGNSQRYLELFIDVAVIYGLLVFVITQAGRVLERRYDVSYKGQTVKGVEEANVYRTY